MGSFYNVDGATGNLITAGSITSTSTTSGFLLPKMTTTQRNAIPTPATGLQIFNITTNQIEFYNGTIWGPIASGSGTVNSGTSGQVAYYASTGTAVSGTSLVSIGVNGIVLNGVNIGITNSNAFSIGSGSVLGLSGSPFVEVGSELYVASNNNITWTDGQGSPHTVSIQAPSTIVSSYSLVWPTAQATSSGQVLTNDGSGNLSWTTGSGVGVTTLATPSIVGCTPGNNQAYYTLLSSKLIFVYGTFSAGSPSATTALTAPPVGTVDITKANPGGIGSTALGYWQQIHAGSVTQGAIWCDGSAHNLKFSTFTGGAGGPFGWNNQNGNVVWASGDFVTYYYTCPLQ